MSELKNLRDKVNQVDAKIIQLVNKRANLAQEIGKIKKSAKEEIFSPAREEEVYSRILKLNKGPLDSKSLKAVYREIMSGAKALEKELAISYLGPEATFAHQAAMTKFGSSVEYIAVATVKDVFLSVEKGEVDYGVVPVENSTEGMVTYTLDMFMESNLNICSEIILNISHNLMVNRNLTQIQKIYSHPQVFNQCRSWLRNNFPRAELIKVSSTAKAAKIIKREKDAAAIASQATADIYKLKILQEGIEDNLYNVTRFLVIGKNYSKRTKSDKTSIVFSVKDRVGALYEALKPFRKNSLNLTKIESRPSKKKVWEYYFYVDFMGHCEELKVKKVLKELEKHCLFVRVLGSYPKSN